MACTAGFLCRLLLILWATLAVHYSNLPWPWLRTVLALLVAGIGIWALWLARNRRAFWIEAGAVVTVMIWWALIPARNDRDWKPEVSVMPRAIIEGDRVKLIGVRNFDYRTRTDFTVRHEEREVELSHLVGVDFFLSSWSDKPIAHTFVSFLFDNAPPLSISIEARLEKGEKYSAIPSLFKQFELLYIVGDERDIVRVRTNYRNERVYLYHTHATPEGARRLLLSYLEAMNRLTEKPEYYALFSNNCTVNIDRHAHRDGKGLTYDPRLLINGYADRFAYAKGILDTSVPFEVLRERSMISEKAKAADQDAEFSKRIREGLVPVR